MAVKSVRLSVGSIFPKGPGKIYFYRYQVDGHRKTVSLQTTNRAEALRKAEEFIPIIKATSPEVIAAHVQQAKGFATAKRDLPLSGVWDYYSMHPDRANPATVHEQLQYKTSLMEFIHFLNNPSIPVRNITFQDTENFAKHLRKTDIAVSTHNRKIKRLRKIFSTLSEFRDDENPFRTILFRKEREEQNIGVRRLAFSREQEQQLREVLADDIHQVINNILLIFVYDTA